MFLRLLWVARQQKKWVLQSPSLRYKVRDLCRHILSSLSIRELISFFSPINLPECPPWRTIFSTRVNSLLFFSSYFLTLPKQALLHLVSAFPQFSTFLITLVSPSSSYLTCHTPSKVSPHPLSPSHISSNLNSLFLGEQSRSDYSIHRILWSEVVLST